MQESKEPAYIPWSRRGFNPLIGIVLISFMPLFLLFLMVYYMLSYESPGGNVGAGLVIFFAYCVLPVISGISGAIYVGVNSLRGDYIALKSILCFLCVMSFGYISPILANMYLESPSGAWLSGSSSPNPSLAEVTGEWKITPSSRFLVMEAMRADSSNYVDLFFKIESNGKFTARTLIQNSLTKVLPVQVISVEQTKTTGFSSPCDLSDMVIADFGGRWQLTPLKGPANGISFFINDSIPIKYYFTRSKSKLTMSFMDRGVPIEFEKSE